MAGALSASALLALVAPASPASVAMHNGPCLADVYELIRTAILERQQVLATYEGHRRELCPHVLGTKDGRRQALFFQFGGGSSTALPRGGDWRCLPLDGLEDVVVREGPWHTAGGLQELETCVDEIDVEVSRDL
jgi:hypothetical protein